ncbi:ChaN family lipoprotein [Posidoniimonas corsicana]|nr:ChaN family lipoprotein [Posidoniimonas corsicana]
MGAMLERVQDADIVFVGESHTDETTHRLQLHIFEELLRRRGGKVVLAMEMFTRDDQPSLDDYLAGRIDEQQFAGAAALWHNYHEAYRPLVERAKQAGAPIVGSNFPKSLLRQFASQGAAAAETLSDDQRRLVPAEFHPNPPDYWRRVDNATRGHAAMGMTANPEDRLFSVQSLWDNAMGDACVQALRSHPDHLVLHINGGFHSAYWEGAVHQAAVREPDAKVTTVAIAPAPSPTTAVHHGLPLADYIAYVEVRASNAEEGVRSVRLSAELEYALHRPDREDQSESAPLLIWLPDEGLSAKEVLPFCRNRYGDQAMIAVVQPPYKSVDADRALGGRWFWPDSFSEDVAAAAGGVEEIWAYLNRHFSVDAERVCVVGEGAGGTVAAVLASRSDTMQLDAIAVRPRHASRLKDLPLVLPQLYAEGSLPRRSLTVVADQQSKNWWQGEISQYRDAEVDASIVALQPDHMLRGGDLDKQIATSLGLDPRESPTHPRARVLAVTTDSPREFLWARIQADWLNEQAGERVTVTPAPAVAPGADLLPTVITPAAASVEGVLPPCPGPFGGTTVLLLPDDADEGDRAAWLALEENDPLTAQSRFHRVRIATLGGAHALEGVLAKLREQNRKNILIVPAVFYTNGDLLRRAADAAKPFEDDMTLQWLPGLGGRAGILKAM